MTGNCMSVIWRTICRSIEASSGAAWHIIDASFQAPTDVVVYELVKSGAILSHAQLSNSEAIAARCVFSASRLMLLWRT